MTLSDLIISGDNKFSTTPAMDALIEKKFKKITNHYGHFIESAKLLFKIDKNEEQVAEANVTVRDKQINATASSDDMYKSLDEMLKKLEVQLEKYKELHFSHHEKMRSAQHRRDAMTAAEEEDR